MEKTPHTLVLFDIDGTLVDCGVAAGKCFSAAFQEAFGVPCPIFASEEVSGLTDAAILVEVVRRLNVRADDFERRRALAFEIYTPSSVFCWRFALRIVGNGDTGKRYTLVN